MSSQPGSELRLADLPLRPELVGEVPYGAPQLDVSVALNVKLSRSRVLLLLRKRSVENSSEARHATCH